MAIPPKGDPRRPLHLAIRSMWMLGGVMFLFATCTIGMFTLRAGRGGGGGPAWTPLVYILPTMGFYVIPGVCYFVFATYLARRQHWALVASIWLAGLQCVIAVLGIVITLLALITNSERRMIGPLTVLVLVVAALVRLIVRLTKSFEAIRITPPEERGFEPIMVPPVPASAMYQQPQQPGGQTHERPNPPAGGDVI